jgi:hypothetical protein
LLEVKDRLRRCDVSALTATLSAHMDQLDDMPGAALLEQLEACIQA